MIIISIARLHASKNIRVISIKMKKQDEKTEEINQAIKEKSENTESKTDTKESEIAELTDTLKRLQAEFENYKKRADKECNNTIKNANAGLIKELAEKDLKTSGNLVKVEKLKNLFRVNLYIPV